MADKTSGKGVLGRIALAGIGLVAVALVGVELFYKAPVPVITGEPIPYDHLSNEALEPYPVRAEPKRDEAGYAATAQERPDVRDCLIADERDKPVPDLRRLDWRAMRNDRDFKVCLWRIFASYGTPERAKAWFEAQGLDSKIMNWPGNSGATLGVYASNMPISSGTSLVHNQGIAAAIKYFAHAENISVGYKKMDICCVSFEMTTE